MFRTLAEIEHGNGSGLADPEAESMKSNVFDMALLTL